MKLVRVALPNTKLLSHDESKDNLPNIITGMADALAADTPKLKDELKEKSPAQGIARFQQHYDIKDLMTEDRLLRKVIIINAETALKRRMTQDEQVALDIGVDLMLQQAVVAFVNLQNSQLRVAAEAELKHLSFLSHDLNNNLGTITLWLQVLRTDLAASDKFGDAIETLDTAQQMILGTIGGMGRLLQAERVRRHGDHSVAKPVNLATVAARIIRLYSAQAERKGTQFVAEIDSEL